jgi:hypothetical protein
LRGHIERNVAVDAVPSAVLVVPGAFRVAVGARHRGAGCVVRAPTVVALKNGKGSILLDALIMTPAVGLVHPVHCVKVNDC